MSNTSPNENRTYETTEAALFLIFTVTSFEATMANPTQKETTRLTKLARTTVKTVNIEAPFERVFAFMANPLNWPKYAVVNMRSVKPGKDGWFETETRFGKGQLKVNAVPEYGIFDHVWRDEQATWNVPARVLRNNSGSTVEIVLFQPPAMTDVQFDAAMAEMNIEMNKLKEILEGQNDHVIEPDSDPQPQSSGIGGGC